MEQIGKIQTVLGLVDPRHLGKTLTHEHLLVNLEPVWGPPENPVARKKYYAPMSPEARASFIHYNYVNAENYMLSNIDEMTVELQRFKDHGGGTIVEVTPNGMHRNPKGLAELSKRTGVNIVMGSSYYVGASHPGDMGNRTETEIVNEIVQDITNGVDGTNIKAGIIGEVGCQWPISDNEMKVLRASGRAQKLTGAPLIIHPGRDEYAPLQILQILQSVGADISRTIMSHIDRTVVKRETMREIAEMGCYLEWDLFGREESWYEPNPDFDMPNDAQRIDHIKWIIKQGLGNKVVISHDIYSKDRTFKYGGHGYFYILSNVVPRMELRGIEKGAIDQIIVKNPARVLTFSTLRKN